MTPARVLLTTPTTVRFQVVPVNFDSESLPEITWSFEPEMRSPTKRVVSESGESMELDSVYLEEETEYTVTVSVR